MDFNRDIRPIFNSQCLACHGGVKRMAEFSLLFRTDALEPTEAGKPAIVPGQPEESELIRRIRHHDPEERMPQDGDPLTTEQIRNLYRWIEQGAEWADHWAYVRPGPQPLPKVSDPTWPQNGIDDFILARLDRERLKPASPAICETLIRRASLDLIGLPPSLEDVDSFCSDHSLDAFENVVDGLLASPHFGERWAAMWLDLARYADSQGYEKDAHRTIWRYREWVIDAFNQDMPFDQFTIEQLAGDLLEAPSEDQIIATAFHRNTMTNDEGGTDDEEFRIAAVIDRVNTTWEVWQGTTMACVQCHSHPYDPFRHEEYFKFFAFFNNTADMDKADEAPTFQTYGRLEKREREELIGAIERIKEEMASPVASAGYDSDAARGLRARLAENEQALEAIEKVPTPVMQELPEDERRKTHVFERGNWLSPLQEVQAGVPASMNPFPADAPLNRLGVAQWLMHPDNSLTARVVVNRFWEQVFGRGLVETVEDFGTQGTPPTHPELLDWLALQFMQEHAWSVKSLLKQIIMSATYQQASHVDPKLLESDPYNEFLARGPRFRLTAEQIRDQALAVSGLLSRKMFGPSVMPSQPEGLWQNPYSDMKWTTSDGEDKYRRAVYTYWRRTVPFPSMMTFDATSREVCVSRRIRTNTPLQALVTLNDPVYVEAAEALADRMAREGGHSPEDQLRYGYRLALMREPSPENLATLTHLYREARAEYEAGHEKVRTVSATEEPTPEDRALALAASVIMNLDEFLTKE